jgi:hypothetical protein
MSHYHTEHGQQHGVVMLGHITTVVMPRGGQQHAVIGVIL